MKRVVGRLSAVLVLVLVASLLLTGLASAEPGKRKIVVFDERVVSEAAQENLIKMAGGEPLKRLGLINGYAVHLPPQAEKALKERPGVLRIDDDLVGQALGKPSGGSKGPSQPPQTTAWGVGRISAPSAWTYNGGTGVKVAVIDSGISTSHPDLRVRGGVNTIKGTKINDDLGHGSHVAGIIAASNNSIGVVGVAPDADLYAVKALNAAGMAYQSDVIEGLGWAVNNTQYGRMDVVNMSLGWTSGNQSFHDAITRTVNVFGVVVVVAAGNSGTSPDGQSTVMWPARYPEVIAVSASNQANSIASFSSRGTEVDLIAPGEGIYSTYKGSGYATMSGTSMAAPHVAGVVALRIARNRALGISETPSEIANALYSTADSLGLDATLQGAGLVNAYDVVAP